MDERIKQRWLTALESGEYKWGRGQLYNYKEDCHCALGVLLEIYIDENPDDSFYGTPDSSIFHDGGLASNVHLSANVRKWADISAAQLWHTAFFSDNTEDYSQAINFIRTKL